MILLWNNKSTTGANAAAVGFRGYLFVRDPDKPMFPSENLVVISVCHLASTLCEAWRYVTPLMDTWTGGSSPAEPLRGSTHLVSINWPAPWLRRVVDPIWVRPGPVPAALGSVFALHSRLPHPFSPFLHCGPGPFNLSTLSQEPTESSTSQPTHIAASFDQSDASRWAQQPMTDRESVTQLGGWPMGVSGERQHFSTPPVLCGACSEPYCYMYSRWRSCVADYQQDCDSTVTTRDIMETKRSSSYMCRITFQLVHILHMLHRLAD